MSNEFEEKEQLEPEEREGFDLETWNEPETSMYVVEEEDDEETTVTLDFENEMIFEQESKGFFLKEAVEDDEIDLQAPPEPPKDAFKEELQDILINTITSKAIASLLYKHKELDKEFDMAIENQRNMGELNALIAEDMAQAMEKRRKELRAAFNGAQVRYEKIPDWAKSYVRDYVRQLVADLSLLTDDN